MKSNNKITTDMFTQKINIKRSLPISILGALTLFLTSCGTHNQGYNQNDGIYSSGNTANAEGEENSNGENSNERSNYYKQYFQSKVGQYDDLPEEGAIFTDIDAYSTSETLDEEGNIVIIEEKYEDGYGPWGSNADNVTVNIYNNSGFGYGHGFGFGYWQSSYWGYPYYGYYNPYWGLNYGWGWGSPYYGYGYGYGYPYYGYGYGYNNHHYYNNHHHNISYNRGRRNTDYGRTEARGRSNNVSTRNSYSRSELTRRVNRNNVRANSNTRDTRSTVRNSQSNQNNTIRNTRSSSTRNNSSVQPTRSNSTRNSNYSTPSRSSSSGSIRSSGGGGRSSGGGGRGRG